VEPISMYFYIIEIAGVKNARQDQQRLSVRRVRQVRGRN
jgi:hypothetical protein